MERKQLVTEMLEASKWGVDYHTRKIKEYTKLNDLVDELDFTFEISHSKKELQKEEIRIELFARELAEIEILKQEDEKH